MLRVLIAFTLVIAGAFPPPAQAQIQDHAVGANPHWIESDTRVASLSARTAFPRRAGSLTLTGTRDISNGQDGTDTTAQYRSEDGQVFGTIYVYLPGLAHSGLASFATRQGILLNSQSTARLVLSETVAAGGLDDIAIRDDYENYRGANSSSAAFIKAGRWQIKIRVTGPEQRRGEVDAAMDALLAGIEFGRQNPAQAPSAISVSQCPSAGNQRDAQLLQDPVGPEIAAHAFLGTFDGGGSLAVTPDGSRNDLPSRVPQELCLSGTIRIGQNSIPILRGADGPAITVDGRTRLIAIISDSGESVEVVHATNLGRYLMLYHQIGSTIILGGYDDVPSDRQIGEMLSNPQSDAGRIRARVVLRPNQEPTLYLPGEERSVVPTT